MINSVSEKEKIDNERGINEDQNDIDRQSEEAAKKIQNFYKEKKKNTKSKKKEKINSQSLDLARKNEEKPDYVDEEMNIAA